MYIDPVRLHQKGISLIELIIFIVIISVALTGILLVMNQVTAHSADPLVRKQAIAAAESLLEEIELQDFIDVNDGVTTVCPPASMVTAATRATVYHIVDCYRGFSMTGTGITDLNNVAVGLANYNANVAIASEVLGSVAAGSAVRITVTVTDPQGNALAIDGYRTRY
jgi:MSHA pilin protein MshD